VAIWTQSRDFVKREFRTGCNDEVVVIDVVTILEFNLVQFWFELRDLLLNEGDLLFLKDGG
jgi:hypothetical protein